ncbi:hypothetical protein NKI07_33185 [Mesorhizobium sp. M0859]
MKDRPADFIEFDGQEGNRLVDRQFENDHRRAQYLEILLYQLGIECQRASVVNALISRRILDAPHHPAGGVVPTVCKGLRIRAVSVSGLLSSPALVR